MHYIYTIPFVVASGLVLALASLFLPKFIPFENISFSRNAALIAAGAGLFWFVGQFLYFAAFSKSPSVSILIPIQVGGIALAGVLTGFLFFKEPLTMSKMIGMASILFGIFFIAKS